MATKEEARQRFDEARAAYDAAHEELREARYALDGHLMEEEARRAAVYLGFEEGDEAGVRAARQLAERRREHKQAMAGNPSGDGEIGGLS